MCDIRFANAPCSWGIMEFGKAQKFTPEKMLHQLKTAGYIGTELGDLGFFPTDAHGHLDANFIANSMNGLDMIGAFVCYDLWRKSAHAEGRAYARKVAGLLAKFYRERSASGPGQKPFRPPHIVLSDSVTHPERISNSSRIGGDLSLLADSWQTLTQEVAFLKKMVYDEFGIHVYYHPHCGSFVETPSEIEALLRDVPNLQLIFDTAHILMGAFHTAEGFDLIEFLKKHADRVYSFHFKDYTPQAEGRDYFELVSNGCFPELGRGIVDFAGVRQWMQENRYNGWVVVEQDILEPDDLDLPFQYALNNKRFLEDLYGFSAGSKM